MKLKAIVTGVTGMVGEGVLHECLQHPDVDQVLVVGRKACGVTHPRLKEIVHSDFYHVEPIADQLRGYNACFFCLGVSAIGKTEAEYFKMTHTLTLHFATVLSRMNPDMVFCYVSGSGTDSSEKGRQMWARVKGKTENDLTKLPFRKVYNFRPGYMHPTKGLKNTITAYKYIGWLYPILRATTSSYVTTLREMGLAMINSALKGYEKTIIEVPDIVALAKK